ncbi:MAG: O-methyltransferase [Chitinophagales bacterium]|nr:O-methyltransferase [Chitinophagales bacterium]MDW8272602.1 O-methyltransferase [Chitinophagales bacterium]
MSLSFLPEELLRYAEQMSSPEDAVLQQLWRETHLKVSMPQMLSGNVQGKFLEFFSRALQPHRILEIGTYTGYSAICLAKGLAKNGHLHTIDVNEELEDMIRKYFELAQLSDKITLHIGDACKVVPELNETFDLVFIDADKENYSLYFDLVIDKVRQGGFIIADNVLWSGKVMHPPFDKDTEAIRAYNEKVLKDPRVESFILPIRDGLNIARKI